MRRLATARWAGVAAGLVVALSSCTSAPKAGPAPSTTSAVSSVGVTGAGTVGAGSAGAGASPTSRSKGPTAPSTSPRATASTARTAPPVQNTLPPPSAIGNVVDKRKDVAVTACSATSDGWAASGVATNPSKLAATYRITVFFTTGGATVQDFGAVTVTVKPGGKTNWSASKKFLAAKPTLCVLRGVG